MPKSGMTTSGLKKLRDRLQKTCNEQEIDRFCTSCAKRIAGQLLRDVTKRTPIGHYDGEKYVCETGISHNGQKVKGKHGGKLQSSWRVGAVEKDGDSYTIVIENNALSDKGVPYAIYVEYGHRTKTGGFVEGHKMLEITEAEIKEALPGVLDKMVADFLRRCLK